MTDTLPTVPESEAEGATALLYADIRAVLGVPVVNLIWRRLAFFPGGLEWAWSAVRPLYASGAAATGAALLRDRTPLPDLPPWPEAALAAAGLGEPERAAIAHMLASYDRGNRLNQVALGALLPALEGAVSEAAPPIAPAAGDPPVEGALPPLPALEALSPPVRALALALDRLGGGDDDEIVTSLWRHLAHWPAFLALAWTALAGPDRDGRLARTIAAGAAAAARVSAGVAHRLDAPAEPPPPEVRETVRLFLDGPIARMTPVSLLLLRLLGR